jgi:hypothetical protein
VSPVEAAAPARPARTAGIVLLAVAAIALVIGVVSLFPGGSSPVASSSTPATPGATNTTSPHGSTPASTSAATTTSNTPSATTTSVAPTSGSGVPTGAPGSASAVLPPGGVPSAGNALQSQVPVRVYNNSYIHGLADRAKQDLIDDGWNVVYSGNYGGGTIPTTTAYYRPGTDEQAAATTLAQRFGMRVDERFAGIEDASPGIIVIVTQDYQGRQSGK